MKLLRLLFFPISIVYGAITITRNAFYNWNFFRSSKFSLPIINVGNLSMGGTGKTPHTEYLIRLLKDNHHLFTLSRGFGRKERGFIIADENSTAYQIGDEPLQYYSKFGNQIGVAVEANRVMGAMDICRIHPETDLILLDDAYQHRAIYAGLTLLITDYSSPFYSDYILPVGNLRELRSGKKRADIIVISKCPDFKTVDKKAIIKKIKPLAHQKIFFSRINYGTVHLVNTPSETLEIQGRNVIVVTGIANPKPLVEHLQKENKILHHFNFNDHYDFKEADILKIHNLFDKFANENPVIITTEKDAMRLLNKEHKKSISSYTWAYQSIKIEIENAKEFNEIVNRYVEENSRDN